MGGFIALMPEILKVVPGVVSTVERLFPGSKRGPEKKAASLTFIKVAVGMTEAALGKDLVQDDLFAEGLGKIINGAVDVMNSINKQEQV